MYRVIIGVNVAQIKIKVGDKVGDWSSIIGGCKATKWEGGSK